MKLNRLILAILVFFQHPVLADIVTDGSIGPAAQSINAIDGQFTIDQELGSLKGDNLFHSFQQFDIERNETATFTGDESILNVISRVTGGNESHINGVLRSKVGLADFYFINPAGVVFGENSLVDVPASFHISTAGELIFADGSSFSALNPEASTLTVATPEAFGFIPAQNGSLKIIGGQLRFKPGTDVSLSANNLDIQQNASITVAHTAGFRIDEQPGLHLNLTAIDSATAHKIPVNNLTDTQATGGALTIENSRIDVSGNGAGRLTARAGTMAIAGNNDSFGSGLIAYNLGSQDTREADGISVDVDSLYLEDAMISSRPISDGAGGRIEIKAEHLKIFGLSGGIFQGTDTNGNAGKITITVKGTMEILNRSISSETAGTGDGGIVDVTAGQLTISGPDSQISSDTFSEGDAGRVRVIATELMKIENGGTISSNTYGSGDAGFVRVGAEQLTVDGSDSGISTDTSGEGNTGDAGDIRVIATELIKILNGGTISSNTSELGNAGNVVVVAGQLTVDGPGSQISSDTTDEGNAGEVSIIITELMEILNGGRISSSTSGPGDAGNITLTSSGEWNRLQNNGQIIAAVLSKKGGVPGDITLTAPVLILDNGQILNKTENVAKKPGGAITIDPQTQIVGGFDLVRKPSSINIISADSGIVSVSPERNLAADLVGVIAPNLNIEGINQDPCTHRDDNSLKSLGHGGAPAFQHGENYLPINRFDESERNPEKIDSLKIMPSINAVHQNTAADCSKFQRTSLN